MLQMTTISLNPGKDEMRRCGNGTSRDQGRCRIGAAGTVLSDIEINQNPKAKPKTRCRPIERCDIVRVIDDHHDRTRPTGSGECHQPINLALPDEGGGDQNPADPRADHDFRLVDRGATDPDGPGINLRLGDYAAFMGFDMGTQRHPGPDGKGRHAGEIAPKDRQVDQQGGCIKIHYRPGTPDHKGARLLAVHDAVPDDTKDARGRFNKGLAAKARSNAWATPNSNRSLRRGPMI